MTRIVSGRLGGRTLRVPQRGTRPTTERVREALFNALEAAGELDGARVLDLYAGSGALGLEALSRGARAALFVEADRAAAEVLRGNLSALGVAGTVRQGTVRSVLVTSPAEPYDLVLADPPYAETEDELAAALLALDAAGWVREGSLVIIERPVQAPAPAWPESMRPLRSRKYGENVLHRAERV